MIKMIPVIAMLTVAIAVSTCERNDMYGGPGIDPEQLFTYIPKSPDGAATPPATPTTIYLYNAGVAMPNFGGRSGADAICLAAAPPAGTTTVHAFLSVSAGDQIRDLVPSLYHPLPVKNYTGTMTISPAWSGLWDGSIDMKLSDAGVLPPGLEWWNGSNADGTNNANNCNAWTSDLTMDTGMIGNSNFITNQWINWSTTGCSTTQYLLCIAY